MATFFLFFSIYNQDPLVWPSLITKVFVENVRYLCVFVVPEMLLS